MEKVKGKEGESQDQPAEEPHADGPVSNIDQVLE
jgi:hypothetical protein